MAEMRRIAVIHKARMEVTNGSAHDDARTGVKVRY